jgi:hypothetical protein
MNSRIHVESPNMTLGMAWVRRLGATRELVAAFDSRLSGGRSWDGCPKLLLLPRSDCVLGFAGDSLDAYPLMLQIVNAINMHPRTLDRTIDIVHLKGHMSRVWKHMWSRAGSAPRELDSLGRFIRDALKENPKLTQNDLVHALKKAAKDGGPTVDDDGKRVTFLTAQGQIKEVSINVLKDRLSRAKKQMRSNN